MPTASTPDHPSAAPTGQPSVNTTTPQSPATAGRRTPQAAPPPESADKPKLPHERDESVDMTHGQPDAQVEQAYRDVQRGLQDTDRGPPADKAYQKQKQ
ncbi:hypothetical protein KW843_17115 [Acidovorax sp. sif1233]|uniref:hypothetical protein n=1 Tax=unclassified Acidovorax TaxID=2684926 RepID=UPI001C4495EA|nr:MULTISPECIES: hypothetical protein [unclassified Acidovorax]MBV7429810.1 hypothetical protein [Acidovorax sp. sif0732]MBV7448888.1 hypothetical protein [Acidovorax sp. sif0715]MBV7456203.1 hypothetical protein [Acidovorax sp. sif1233]